MRGPGRRCRAAARSRRAAGRGGRSLRVSRLVDDAEDSGKAADSRRQQEDDDEREDKAPDDLGVVPQRLHLLGSVQPVARVAEPRDDVAPLVEPAIDRRRDDPDVGMPEWTRSIPSGAETRQTSVTERAPASFTFAIAATLEFPVASIGSRTMASRSARSLGSLT